MGLHPRPHQIDALTDLARALAVHDKAQLVMACGTGKTLVARWHAQAADASRVVVLVPTLALLAQTLGEWRRPSGWPFEALVVCSDPSTSAGAAERARPDADEAAVPDWAAVRAAVTTSPAVAAAFLPGKAAGRHQVLFSTYHSAPVVVAAQAASGVAFDLAVCDEAHNLAGRPREEFRVVLDRRALVARKRLFLTATPEILGDGHEAISMDDMRLFGPIAHTVSFSRAIGAGLLADYQVLVIAGRPGQADTDEQTPQTLPSAVLAAVDNHHIGRLLTYHSRVARAAGFAAVADGARTPSGRIIRARHVSAATPAAQRAESLRWLGEPSDGEEVRLLASARALNEGVDVPSADGVMFCDRRSSVTDIIQAVGRVLRPAAGKQIGTVIVPVTLPPDGDDDSALGASAFAHVWAVLRGLRAHDQRLAAELDSAAREYARGRITGARPAARVRFLLPDGFDRAALQLRLIQETGAAWERFHGLLLDWAEVTGGRMLPWNATWKGAQLGRWAEQQRAAHREHLLPAARIEALEQVPGWAWDRADGHWHRTLQLLHQAAAELGGLRQAASVPSIYSGRTDSLGRPLGNWAALQRQDYRDGFLDPGRAAALEALPGWSWDAGLPADDVAMIQALRVFCEFEKTPDVPESHTEDGLPLGRWAVAVRRRKLTGRLHPALAEEIAAAPPRGPKGCPTFRWQAAETQWRLAYSALRAFAAREGHAVPPASHREELPDATIRLGQWAVLQRHKQRRGSLPPRYATWLEAVAGWKWEVPLARTAYGEPIDLDGHRHGTAKGIAAGCTCRECLDSRRAADRTTLARWREIPDGVPAGRARRHLARLEKAGAKRTAIAATSGVPIGTLRTLAAGRPQISELHEAVLLATTAAMCATVTTRRGSRGRIVSADSERIAAGPTHAILTDLAARGFGSAWVARELGYAGGLQIGADTVTRRTAKAIAGLAARAEGITAPPAVRNRRVPPLAELLERHQAASAGRVEGAA